MVSPMGIFRAFSSMFKKNLLCKYWLVLLLPLLITACNTNSTIANNLSEREANEIVVLLRSKGIEAFKVQAVATGVGGGGDKTWDIQVPARSITDALAVLNSSGLPRVKGTSLLDLFGTQGLVPSELQNKIRYQEGLSEQLANTIRKMDGIIDANVQITLSQDDDEEKQEMTASVYVKHRGILDNPNSLLITKIKRLISSAIPGLKTDNVSVVADRALFADITLEQIQMGEQFEYVSIWGVTVARGSTALFRTILYIFILVIFLLACLIAWLGWKTYPVIRRNGWRSFLSPQPYAYEVVSTEEQTAEEYPTPAPRGGK
ncbi:MAG: type III secretion system inner membrane ring lipoprotein SctJ [Chlamydiales bacterium]